MVIIENIKGEGAYTYAYPVNHIEQLFRKKSHEIWVKYLGTSTRKGRELLL